MSEALEDAKKNNKVRSVIICSLVPGVFCAGGLLLSVQKFANPPVLGMKMRTVMEACEKAS